MFQTFISISAIILSLVFGYITLFYEDKEEKSLQQQQIDILIAASQLDSAIAIYKIGEKITMNENFYMSWKTNMINKNYLRNKPTTQYGDFEMTVNQEYIYIPNIPIKLCIIFNNYIIVNNSDKINQNDIVEDNANALFGCLDTTAPTNRINNLFFFYRIR